MIATVCGIESAYVEWRRQLRTGLRRRQERPLAQKTNVLTLSLNDQVPAGRARYHHRLPGGGILKRIMIAALAAVGLLATPGIANAVDDPGPANSVEESSAEALERLVS